MANRAKVIQTIRTPLAFFALALLIVEAFLATVLIWAGFNPEQKLIGMWAGLGVFVLVTMAVFLLVWCKPQHLTYDKEAHLIATQVLGQMSSETPSDITIPEPASRR